MSQMCANGAEGHTSATSSSALPRPGTEERRGGRVAALDPSMLPRLHAVILKDDVQIAADIIDEAEGLAAEHRVKCHTEAKENGRRKAVVWRKRQIRRTRARQEMARQQEEMLQRQREEEAEEQAKHENEVRWRKAFHRIKFKESKRNAVVVTVSDEEAQQPLCAGLQLLADAANKPSLAHAAGAFAAAGKRWSSGAVSQGAFSDISEEQKPITASFSWRLKQEPLDHHIQYLRKLQRLRTRSTRLAQQYELRKMRYERLHEEERRMCEAAFSKFGADPQSRVLDVHGVRDCLYEVGARGFTVEEQMAVRKVCREAHRSAAKMVKTVKLDKVGERSVDPFSEIGDDVKMAIMNDGINLYTFATTVLPHAKKQLEHIHRVRVEELYKEGGVHLEGEAYITID